MKDTSYPQWTYTRQPDWQEWVLTYHNRVWPRIGYPALARAGEGPVAPPNLPTNDLKVALAFYESQYGGNGILCKTLSGRTRRLLDEEIVTMVGYPRAESSFANTFTGRKSDELDVSLETGTVRVSK